MSTDSRSDAERVLSPSARAAQAEPAGYGVRDLFAVLRRRRRILFSTMAVATVLGALAGARFTQTYTAEAELLINSAQQAQPATQSAAIDTELRLIKSRDQERRFARLLDLAHDPEFNPALQPGNGLIAMLTSNQVIGRALAWLPDQLLVSAGLADEAVGPRLPAVDEDDIIDSFDAKFIAYQEGHSYVATLSVTSSDPAKAARMVNTVAQSYVRDRLDAKAKNAATSLEWLDKRLQGLRTELQDAEQAVQQFRVSHNLIAAQGGSLNDQQLADANRELNAARAELVAKKAKLDLVRRPGQALDSIPEVLDNPLIVSLREQEAALLRREQELRALYGDKHPQIRDVLEQKASLEAKINGEIQRIIRNVANDVQVMTARTATLQEYVDRLTKEVGRDHTESVQLAELERRAQATRELYEASLRQYEEARGQATTVPDVTVASLADPPELPRIPRPVLFGAVAFTMSLSLGSFLAPLRDRLDTKLRDGRGVARELGLPTLAQVPRLRLTAKGRRPHRYILAKPLSAYTEAIRAIDGALWSSRAERNGPTVVLVTSSVPDEGKTTLATSLAAFAAYSGRRTLIVDLDLRHPGVHCELGLPPAAGLVELLTDDVPLRQVILRDETGGFDALPVRRLTSNPTALLGGPELRRLIDGLRRSYDFIVLDSAPLLDLTDTRVAAGLADRIVFAVRWGKIEAETARESLHALGEARARVTGVALTQVDLHQQARDIGHGASHRRAIYRKYYIN